MTVESKRFQDIIGLCILPFLLFTLIFAFSSQSYANEAQYRLCQAGISLGQAEARVELFGKAFKGAIPGNQLTAIASNLTNASSAISSAEALFNTPFSTERSAKGYGSQAISKISGYATNTSGMSYSHKANYIKNIYEVYHNSLQYTFVSSRPDAFQWNPNCDSLTLKACYHFGRASLASAVGGRYARTYENAAVGSMNHTIVDGLAIAMDPGHKPFDGHAKKICCSFGSPGAWSPLMSNIKKNPAVYNQHQLLGIVRNSRVEAAVCKPSYAMCPSCDYGVSGGKFTGRWKCYLGDKEQDPITVTQNGNSASLTTPDGTIAQGEVRGGKLYVNYVYQDGETRMVGTLKPGGNTMDLDMKIYAAGEEVGEFVLRCTK